MLMLACPGIMPPSRATELVSPEIHHRSRQRLQTTCDTNAGPSVCVVVLHCSRCGEACSNRHMHIRELRDCGSEQGLGICDTLVPVLPCRLSNLCSFRYSQHEQLSHVRVSARWEMHTMMSSNPHRNARGYEVAKQHKEKLSHICPVWYQLKVQDATPVLTGGHDVDAEWMTELRKPEDEVCAPKYLISILALAE